MRYLTLLFWAIFSLPVYAQHFVLTPDGFKNEDRTLEYVVVPFENATKQDIFNKVHTYIMMNYVSPKEVMSISGNDVISIHAISTEFPFCDPMGRKHTGVMTYKMTFQFRDGRMKVTFVPVNMTAYFNTHPTDLLLVQQGMKLGIFKRNGDLTRGGRLAIEEIEKIPNSIIDGVIAVGEKPSTEDDW